MDPCDNDCDYFYSVYHLIQSIIIIIIATTIMIVLHVVQTVSQAAVLKHSFVNVKG
jgi:hypothetical protein